MASGADRSDPGILGSMRSGIRTALLLLLVAGVRPLLVAQQHGTGAEPPDTVTYTSIPYEVPFILDKGFTYPEQVDLTRWFPAPGDQFAQASCSGWAIGYALTTYAWNRHSGRVNDSTGSFGNMDPRNVFSPSFLYGLTILGEDNRDCAIGVSLADAVLVACNTGCCTLEQYPVDTARHNCLKPIPDSAFVEARRHRMSDPKGLNNQNTDQQRYHLAQGTPVVFQVTIDDSFKQGFRTAGDKMFVWQPPDVLVNKEGHIMVAVGYDDRDSTFLVQNSWGEGWGLRGRFKLPYEVMRWTSTEAYIMQRNGESELVPLVPAFREDPFNRRGLSRGRMREGEAILAEDIAWHAVDIEPKAGQVDLQVVDPTDTSRVHRIVLRDDQPVTFHHEGSFYTITADVSRKREQARYRVVRDDPAFLSFRDRALKRAEELDDGPR